MLHSRVWIVLDPDGSGEPVAVLMGSANLTQADLFKNDEAVGRAAPEERGRIHDDLMRSMRSSWDAKAELSVRLGEAAREIGELPAVPTRRRPVSRRGAFRSVVAGLALAAVAAAFVILGLPWVFSALDGLASEPSPAPAEPVEQQKSAASDRARSSAGTAFASATADTVAAQAGGPDRLAETDDASEVALGTAAPACAYTLPDGSDACGLLDSLGGADSVRCGSLPADARPLRLSGDANPAGYEPAHYAPVLVCTWIDGGTFVAGETIPAGDLRAVNATVWGSGACHFEVYDETGTVIVSRGDYERENWAVYALLRLSPGATITTSGCGWVPAEHAGLGPGADGIIGTAQHEGRRYPLLVGTDVPPGNVRIECEYWAWPDAQPDENGSWAASLRRREAELRAPGPHRAESGIIWPKC